jgi:hypothetical protein
MINTSHIAEPIKLSYLSSTEESITSAGSSNSEDESNELGQWIDGSAIKLAVNRWQVMLSNGENFIVKTGDFLDNNQYFVNQAFEKLQKQKQAQKPSAGGAWNMKSMRKSSCVKPIGNKNKETWKKFTEITSKIVGAVPGEPCISSTLPSRKC